MERTRIGDLQHAVGTEVLVKGWVDTRRDHGKLIFLDLRDASGLIQAVVPPGNAALQETASRLRSEWVVAARARVNERPAKMVNAAQPNGTIELEILDLTVLSESDTPPFDLSSDGRDIDEATRLAYRYLDLRRPRLQRNLRLRSQVMQFVRNYLVDHHFVEIETPILTKSTPEGARDYVVPSRLYPGKFYALPQSPQQYKQLLMTGGLERYFQLARCFRDEDTRGDRQPEFTQLDLELSFVTREDVMALNEDLLIALVQTLAPEKKIQTIPFPRISYQEALQRYGTDRPDLRTDKDDPDLLAFCWIIDFPFFEKADEYAVGTEWTFTHNPFSAPVPEHLEWLMAKKNIGEILTTQYDVALNGFEIGGGSIRNHRPEALQKVFEILGYPADRITENFGHMLEAFRYGTPPHGGIAWGFDRLITLLTNEPNIREVMAFPKTGEGRDLMMDSPAEISAKQKKELGLK